MCGGGDATQDMEQNLTLLPTQHPMGTGGALEVPQHRHGIPVRGAITKQAAQEGHGGSDSPGGRGRAAYEAVPQTPRPPLVGTLKAQAQECTLDWIQRLEPSLG